MLPSKKDSTQANDTEIEGIGEWPTQGETRKAVGRGNCSLRPYWTFGWTESAFFCEKVSRVVLQHRVLGRFA